MLLYGALPDWSIVVHLALTTYTLGCITWVGISKKVLLGPCFAGNLGLRNVINIFLPSVLESLDVLGILCHPWVQLVPAEKTTVTLTPRGMCHRCGSSTKLQPSFAWEFSVAERNGAILFS